METFHDACLICGARAHGGDESGERWIIHRKACPYYDEENDGVSILEEPRGLYRKYVVEKANGEPVDPKAVYFTLRLDTDPHARAAVRAYAESVREENGELAEDLEKLLKKLYYENENGH